MGIYKLPKNQWTKDGRKYKYYWNEKDKSGKWKKKFSQAVILSAVYLFWKDAVR